MEIFLSTPSARRATYPFFPKNRARTISIHALREEGDVDNVVFLAVVGDISIHALREEGDLAHSETRRALSISIHALREEGDRS